MRCRKGGWVSVGVITSAVVDRGSWTADTDSVRCVVIAGEDCSTETTFLTLVVRLQGWNLLKASTASTAAVVCGVLLQSVRTDIMEFTVMLLIATLILVVLWIFNSKARKHSRLPPGPPGIPLLGNLLQLDKKAPFKTFLKVRKHYINPPSVFFLLFTTFKNVKLLVCSVI